jgi:hypothetical protein
MYFVLAKVHNVLAGWCSGKTADLYSGCTPFESRLEHRLSLLSFLLVSSDISEKGKTISALGRNPFLPNHFQFTIHKPSYCQRYGVRAIDIVVVETINKTPMTL